MNGRYCPSLASALRRNALGLALTGSYTRVERIGIDVGLAEIAFIPVAVLAHPNLRDLGHGLSSAPLGSSAFLFLLAANVGAVIDETRDASASPGARRHRGRAVLTGSS